MRKLLHDAGLEDRVEIDSAGTHAYHVGEPPDARSQEAALRRGVDLSDLRARAVEVHDFHAFDYLLAMDRANLELLERARPQAASAELKLMLEFADGFGDEVPDPYYGGADGFENVLDMLEESCQGLIDQLANR